MISYVAHFVRKMKSLVMLTTIKSVRQIPSVDAIDAVTMMANDRILFVKKGAFKLGDQVVYFEVDSPISVNKDKADDCRFKFLSGHCDKKINDAGEYYLVTVKLRDCISQRIVLPFDVFPQIGKFEEGRDVAALLDVTPYETPIVCDRRELPDETSQAFPSFVRVWSESPYERICAFPSFLRKPSQRAIQEFKPEELKLLSKYTYEATIKMDGVFCMMYSFNGRFGVCSRDTERHMCPDVKVGLLQRCLWWWFKCKYPKRGRGDRSLYWNAVIDYDIERKLSEYCKQFNLNLAIQGEICGIGVQGNREQIPGQTPRFFVFDIFDIREQCYLLPTRRQQIISELGLEHVPIVATNFAFPEITESSIDESSPVLSAKYTANDLIELLLAMAEGDGLYTDTREGLVFKANQDTNVSFKVISNKYLL